MRLANQLLLDVARAGWDLRAAKIDARLLLDRLQLGTGGGERDLIEPLPHALAPVIVFPSRIVVVQLLRIFGRGGWRVEDAEMLAGALILADRVVRSDVPSIRQHGRQQHFFTADVHAEGINRADGAVRILDARLRDEIDVTGFHLSRHAGLFVRRVVLRILLATAVEESLLLLAFVGRGPREVLLGDRLAVPHLGEDAISGRWMIVAG